MGGDNNTLSLSLFLPQLSTFSPVTLLDIFQFLIEIGGNFFAASCSGLS